jgi:hypothetical protein
MVGERWREKVCRQRWERMEGKRMLDNHQNKAVLLSCKWWPSRPIGGQPADGDKFLTRRQGPDWPTA